MEEQFDLRFRYMGIGWEWEWICQVKRWYGTDGYGDRLGQKWCVGDGGEWNKNFCAEFCNRQLLSYVVKCCEMRECISTAYGMMMRWLYAAVGSSCCSSTGSSTTH